MLEHFLSSGNKAKKKSVFEVFAKLATRETELKCHKNCQNFYSYPALLSGCVGNTVFVSHGVVKLIPCLLKSVSCVLGGTYGVRGTCWGFCISSYWSSSWTMNHLNPSQGAGWDPPVWGASGPWLRICFSWSFE